MDIPKAPKHLSKEAQRLWGEIIEECDGLDDSQLWLLRGWCEVFDRKEEIRQAINREGVSVVDRWGQTKPNPLLAEEKGCHASMRAYFKHLNLDLDAD